MWDYFRDSFAFAKEIIFNPFWATKEISETKNTIIYLFIISLIPALLNGIVSFYTAEISERLFSASLSVIITLLYFVFAMIGAAFIHGFGKLFKLIKRDYSFTFAALAYASTPVILFGWLQSLLGLVSIYLNIIFGLIIGVWSFILEIYALSNQHKIEKIKALLLILIPVIVIVAITIVLAGFAFVYISSIITHTISSSAGEFSTVTLSDYYCAAGNATIILKNYGSKDLLAGSLTCNEIEGKCENACVIPAIEAGKTATVTVMGCLEGNHAWRIAGNNNAFTASVYCSQTYRPVEIRAQETNCVYEVPERSPCYETIPATITVNYTKDGVAHTETGKSTFTIEVDKSSEIILIAGSLSGYNFSHWNDFGCVTDTISNPRTVRLSSCIPLHHDRNVEIAYFIKS